MNIYHVKYSTFALCFILTTEIDEGDAAVIHAYELVDWLRLIEGDLDPDTIKRVVAIIKRFYAPALTSFYSYLSPNLELIRYSFADGSNVMSSSSSVLCLSLKYMLNWFYRIPVSWLLYIPTYQFSFPEFCSVLTSALQDQQIPLHLYKSLAGLFMHRINQNPDNIEDIMNALATVLGYAKASLPFREFVCLKNFIWEERQCLRNLSCDSQSQNSTCKLHMDDTSMWPYGKPSFSRVLDPGIV